jgi:hypothetical protein
LLLPQKALPTDRAFIKEGKSPTKALPFGREGSDSSPSGTEKAPFPLEGFGEQGEGFSPTKALVATLPSPLPLQKPFLGEAALQKPFGREGELLRKGFFSFPTEGFWGSEAVPFCEGAFDFVLDRGPDILLAFITVVVLRGFKSFESLLLMMMAYVAQAFMLHSCDLVSFYVCLEAQNFSFIVLCGLQPDKRSNGFAVEASLKFLLLSAF